MKLYLLEDVKGRGKAGDTIDVALGFGLFLVKGKKALDYSKNSTEIEAIIAKKKADADELLAQANILKDMLAGVVISLERPLAANGSLQKAITKSELSEYLPAQIDKRSIQTELITTVGNFTIPVKLHPQVVGSFRVVVKSC